VRIAHIDYDNESTLISALEGQQFLIITLPATAPPETHSKLVRAAAAAGVPYVMPNAYGTDLANESLLRDELLGSGRQAKQFCSEIEAAGVSSWVVLGCGLWYEYSLVLGPMVFGFDHAGKKMTMYDQGEVRINVTTFEQCARAVAGLLSLPELPWDEGEDVSGTVSGWRNRTVYVASFLVSQREMFESWKRVTGEREGSAEGEWTVEYVGSRERYEQGKAMAESAKDPFSWRMGAATASFVRMFYPDSGLDYESTRGLANGVLGLPKEDLDERTAVAKKMLDDGYQNWVFARLQNASG
jgi:hypothetical protein